MKNLQVSNVFIHVIYLVLLSARILKASESVDHLSYEKCALENSDCLKKQAQAVLHTFVQGIPELDIKEFDSLRMDDIDVKALDVHYAMNNLVVRGFNNTIIDDLSVNMAYRLIRLSFHTTLMIDCDYLVDGKMFGIPVFGDGRAAIIIKKLKVEMLIAFDMIKNEQGKEIMNITNFLLGGDAIDGTYAYLEDLYDGDKVQSDQFHELINKNWRTIAANFVFTIKIINDVFEAIKIYMRSKPLAELAQYSNK